MPVYIALLRAVNVKPRWIKMDVLRAQVALLGFSDVKSHVQSGNLVFKSKLKHAAEVASMLEIMIQAEHGFLAETFVRNTDEISAIAKHRPFGPEVTGDRLYVGFARETITPTIAAKLLALNSPTDPIHVMGSEVYWHPLAGAGQSKAGAKLSRIAAPITFRNENTVRALAELASAA